jgi:hypothetical protein
MAKDDDVTWRFVKFGLLDTQAWGPVRLHRIVPFVAFAGFHRAKRAVGMGLGTVMAGRDCSSRRRTRLPFEPKRPARNS